MQRLSVQFLITVLVSAAMLHSATPSVGLATAKGVFSVDRAPVAGSAALFEGSAIETSRVPGELHLKNGARMSLAAESRGVVYRDRLVLERGIGQADNLAIYGVEAATLRISGQPGSAARVSLTGLRRVEVAALTGAVQVSNAAGVLVANLGPGRVLEFSPEQAGAAPPSKVTGCVVESKKSLVLTDDVSAVTFVLKGQDLRKHLLSRAEVTGVVDPAATQASVLIVTGVRTLTKRCSEKQLQEALAKAAAVGAGAGALAGAGAGTGAAAGTVAGTAAGVSTGAIVGGVVVAAAATGGAIAAVKANDDPAPISPSQP